jgi:hypothetical protein
LIRQIKTKVEKLEASHNKRESTATFVMGSKLDLQLLIESKIVKKTYFLVVPDA